MENVLLIWFYLTKSISLWSTEKVCADLDDTIVYNNNNTRAKNMQKLSIYENKFLIIPSM